MPALCVLITGAWIASAWWWFEWWTPVGINVGVGAGVVGVGDFAGKQTPGPFGVLYHGTHPYAMYWWFHARSDSKSWRVMTPVWVFLIPMMVLAARAWRAHVLARRRERAGGAVCAQCGYDRGAIPRGSACPECGAAGSGAEAPVAS